MTAPGTRLFSSPDYSLREIDEADLPCIVEAYALLQETMGTDAVEDLNSFRRTVSASTDDAVAPKLVCAVRGGEMIGVIVGAYLKTLKAGFIAYSGVKEAWRRRGIYTAMRNELVGRFKQEGHIVYVISELEEDGWLYLWYLEKWNATVLPCAYQQPEAQGLRAKTLKLVLQPLARRTPPDEHEMFAIIREVYQRIYRIPNVTENESFGRIVASLTSVSAASSSV